MANKSFDDVQVFFKFQDILDNKSGDLRRKVDKETEVDLLSNLDPSGETNTAIELAKIYSWFDKMFDYTAPGTGETEGDIKIKEDVIPDSVKGAVTEGYYDPETGKFYEDASKQKEIERKPGRIYVDKFTDTPYRYDDGDEKFQPLDHDTKYSFKEGTKDGTFIYQEDDGIWNEVKIHNVPTLTDGKIPSEYLPSYVDDVIEGYFVSPNFYEDESHQKLINPESGKIYVDLTTNKTYRWGSTSYVEISASLALGDTSSTAYPGDKGKEAYEHSQKTGTGTVSEHNPHGLSPADIGLDKVSNTPDNEKEVKSADTLKTARKIDGVNFDGSKDISHYGVCDTGAADVNKTVTCDGFNLVTGAWIAVKFTTKNTGDVGNLTLNVNSTGAMPIKYRNANLPSVATLDANRTYMFVYDGANYQLIGDLDANTDTKVRQTLDSADKKHPLLMSYAETGNGSANVDNVSYRNDKIYANPATGTITADKFVDSTGKEAVMEDNILILHCNNNPSLLP